MSLYLDSAATTKIREEVIDSMMPYFTEKWYNPSSLYKAATDVKEEVKNARKYTADYIGAKASEIYFTSGGSESNSWALQGFVNYCLLKNIQPTIITSTIEHKSILNYAQQSLSRIRYVGVNKAGRIILEELERLLEAETIENPNKKILVSIQYANNEIGTIQDIKAISEVVHRYGGVFHTDAVQVFGNLPINVSELGIDMLSASGHKIGCPKGIGILYKRQDVNINPIIYGTQMDGMRGGTENVPYIAGFTKAIELLESKDVKRSNISIIRDELQRKLLALGCLVNGESSQYCLPNIINVTVPNNVTGESLVQLLSLSGIYISTGSACNESSVELSHVLKAIGLSDDEIHRTIRITISDDVGMQDVDYIIGELVKQIRVLELSTNI